MRKKITMERKGERSFEMRQLDHGQGKKFAEEGTPLKTD